MIITYTDELVFNPSVKGEEIYSALEAGEDTLNYEIIGKKEENTATFHINLSPENRFNFLGPSRGLYLNSEEGESILLALENQYNSFPYQIKAYRIFFSNLSENQVEKTNEFFENIYNELGRDFPEELLLEA